MARTHQGPAVPRWLQPNYDTLVSRDAPTLNRISALRTLRINLDEFEQVLVAAARSEGATWDAIGQAMYITKQAAQKRYALGPNDE